MNKLPRFSSCFTCKYQNSWALTSDTFENKKCATCLATSNYLHCEEETEKPLTLKTVRHSTVDYIDHMGSDLTVVNAARVSFDKESNWEHPGSGTGEVPVNKLFEKDKKLITYLAKHNHWSPFAHTSIQFRVSAPIFVARQLVKHQIGGIWNEVSRRYVNDEPSFYMPQWRWSVENKKQGSGDVVDKQTQQEIDKIFWTAVDTSLKAYISMLEKGVSPEQARAVLNLNHMTSWYWSGSLVFFNRVYKQRIDSHAQIETKEVAELIGIHCKNLFPVSWEALTKT